MRFNATPASAGLLRPEASDLHGLGKRRTGGQSVCAESAGVAAAPVVDDVAFAGAPQHAHHGLLESLRRATADQDSDESHGGVEAQTVCTEIFSPKADNTVISLAN